ncbi:MAG: DUF1616 domain-containing protein [Actinomycetota bacterium]
MRGHQDLAVAAAAAVTCALFALLVPFELVRLAVAVPLALLLPGYAISAAAFGPRPPGPVRLLALSLGLSLITLVLGTLVLNYAPGGLRAGSWAALLVLVVLVGCVVAAVRRGEAPSGRFRWPRPRLTRSEGGLLLGAALAFAAAGVISSTALPAKNAEGYTRLWMLPASGAEASGVRVGVINQEHDTVAYRLEVQLGHRRNPVVRRFFLQPGQKRRVQIPVGGLPTPAKPVPVTALLFRRADPDTAYRRVTGWTRGARATP